MADFKDFVAVGAVLVSAGSAFFAYNANLRSTEANQQANAMRAELDSSKFTADTSIRLLEMTYKTFAEADTPTEVFGACQYASSLAEVETKAMPGQNSLIQGFLDRVAARDDTPLNCKLLVSETRSVLVVTAGVDAGSETPSPTPSPAPAPAPAPEPAPAPAPEPAPGPTPEPAPGPTPEPAPGPTPGPADDPSPPDAPAEELITWHAVISSYNVTEKGCEYAKQDLDFYAARLREPDLAGRTIGIYLTSGDKYYAVAVDAGDDQMLAQKAQDLIRMIASDQAKPEGADAFVQQSASWSVDSGCGDTATL